MSEISTLSIIAFPVFNVISHVKIVSQDFLGVKIPIFFFITVRTSVNSKWRGVNCSHTSLYFQYLSKYFSISSCDNENSSIKFFLAWSLEILHFMQIRIVALIPSAIPHLVSLPSRLFEILLRHILSKSYLRPPLDFFEVHLQEFHF